jgi:acyl transferase domain-containing protein/NADPH:quinone reductase-like Zn-dependent oxidoreductase/SAM-dependent methyltransferase/acyl carrier protein
MRASQDIPGYPSDAIAIVGVGCRLPGGITDVDGLWSALEAARDLVTEVPPDRFDGDRFLDPNIGRPGKTYTLAGGFLSDVKGFDVGFFGISPREASRMDPQQRLLLEMAVEALDDAGIDPALLAGSDTAVFVGVSAFDYGSLQHQAPQTINAYTNAGIAATNIANRISYFFDFHGPSMAIDTACSSALVAFHEACQHLRLNGSRVALVGGVHILINPLLYVGFAKAGMLSLTGRCQAFSAEADGYVRAEGGGLVVLKRLPDALADGDRIHAVVVGTGVNTDGRTMGMALPSCQSQETLLREVYARNGVDPDGLVYVEAHGTGTAVGDPVECAAIGRALGLRRQSGRPLPIGSVKTNLGHLEPASGIAGLLKSMLVLRHGTIPASLHGTPSNPKIDFEGLRLAPVHEACPVEVNGHRALVGVNSFGFGGVNAHVVVAEPPKKPKPVDPQLSGLLPVVVSARSQAALTEVVRQFGERFSKAGPDEFYDLCYTASRRRGHYVHRAAVLAGYSGEAAEQLLRLIGEEPGLGGAFGTAVPRGKVAFVFSGNGCQWATMGADLLVTEPTFRSAVERMDALLHQQCGWSVLEELAAAEEESRLERTEFAQPTLFAVQVGLVELLAERGIRPAAVFGHSVGEVAAAYVAGALDLDGAVRVIAERSRVQAPTTGLGRMAAVGLPRDQAEEALSRHAGRLELAGVNSDRDVTISGDDAALKALGAQLAAREVFFRELEFNYAFHSRAMDQIEEPLRTGLAGLQPEKTRIPLVSTVTGQPVRGDELKAEYWWRNVRQPVLFAAAAQHLIAEGFDVFVEIGAHPILGGYLRRLAISADDPVAVIPTLSRGCDGPGAVQTAVAALLAAGADVDWKVYFPRRGRVVDLPAYPWQREVHWNGSPDWWVGKIDHPLLGVRQPVLDPTWQASIDQPRVPWLADHKVASAIVMPAAGYVEMALAAGRRALSLDASGEVHAGLEVDALDVTRALVLHEDDSTELLLQVSVSGEDGVVRVASRMSTAEDWQAHARGRVRRLFASPPPPIDVDAVRKRMGVRLDGATHYGLTERAGLSYGPAFQVLRELHAANNEVLACYTQKRPVAGYEAHPTILDGALQAVLPLLAEVADGQPFLPTSVGRVRCWQPLEPTGFVHVKTRTLAEREVSFDITITDDAGVVAVELHGCRMRRFDMLQSNTPVRHVTVSRAAPHLDVRAGRSPLPTPTALVETSADRLTDVVSAWRRESRYAKTEHLGKELTAHAAVRAFTRILPEKDTFTTDDVLAAGVALKYARLVHTLASMAHAQGLLERVDDAPGKARWRVVADARLEAVVQAWVAEALEDAAAVTLWGRCGLYLPEVLRGELDPLELLFPGYATETIEHFYAETPVLRFLNRLAQVLVRTMVNAWPADRPLRVLEVGAGTGGMTAAVLPLLPAERARYVFTDISEAFFMRAQNRFAAYDFVEYRRLDLDRGLSEQGFHEGSFDLIVASHVLHAAKDLKRALRRLAELLTDGGQLLAVEPHDPELLALPFGLLDGWWTFTDLELRTDSPLLARDDWPVLLRGCGFTNVVQLGDEDEPARGDYSVILAQHAGTPTSEPALPVQDHDGSWIVATEDAQSGALASELVAALTGAGCQKAAAVMATDDPDEWSTQIATGAPSVGIVLILGEAGSSAENETDTARVVRQAAVIRVIASACAGLPSTVTATFWLVTRPTGALPAPETPQAPADAALWGAARCLANEQPGLIVKRVSFQRGDSAVEDARRLARELLTPSDEDEIVLTRSGRFVPRVVEAAPVPQMIGETEPVPYTLKLCDQGSSYRLSWVEAKPVAPGPDEVAIAVRAAALNYRDVLWVVGLLPGEAVEGTFFGPRIGLECAGVVTAVGSGVTAFQPGDRVFAAAPGSFGSDVVTHAGLIGHLPDGMSFTEAATLPVVFSTVHHSLSNVARLVRGEVVLVHGAAGGVGLAALQYAQHVGAHVIATAGSPEKRDLLRLLGVEHVLDSRSLAFADQVREITNGRGVDVVLNSLSGEAIPRSLELLRPGGRFIELGKRDIYENKPLLLRPFRNNVSLCAVDVDQLLHKYPAGSYAMFREITERIQAGVYHPLLHRAYPAVRIGEAFRLMQHSRHTGKVIITFDEPVPVERRHAPVVLDPDATYLVTGGLGGFGAATAQWLADRGARHLALVSRRGPDAPEAQTTIDALAKQGVEAIPYAADVTNLEAMQRVIGAIDATGHPLRGVVHAAMVLDDAPLGELTSDRFRTALAPKMQGGLVLDQLTRNRYLDLFIAFSSVTAQVGQIRQANYAAGNLFLEALVRQRRRANRPGLAVAWGAIGEVGYVARHGLETLASRYMPLVSPAEAFAVLDELLAQHSEGATVGRYNWDAFRDLLPCIASPRWAGIMPDRNRQTGMSRDELLRLLINAPPEEAQKLIEDLTTGLIASVLHTTPEQIDRTRRLDQLGLDSLMAVELLSTVRRQFGIDIPIMQLAAGGRIRDLAQQVFLRVRASSPQPAASVSHGNGGQP